MGKSADYGKEDSLYQKTQALLEKAGFEVVFPENINELCCGMAFDSKGFKNQGKEKGSGTGKSFASGYRKWFNPGLL